MTRNINPASLRIVYKAYSEPVEVGFYNGQPIIHHGFLRVEWDSPDGPLAFLTSAEKEPHPDTIEELRPLLALQMSDSYEAVRPA